MYNCYMKGREGRRKLERYCVQTHKSLKLEMEKTQTTWGQHRVIICNGSSLMKSPKEIAYG